MPKERFTAWLSPEEREGLRVKAAKMGASQNYLVRVAIRRALGLSVSHIPLLEESEDAQTLGSPASPNPA